MMGGSVLVQRFILPCWKDTVGHQNLGSGRGEGDNKGEVERKAELEERHAHNALFFHLMFCDSDALLPKTYINVSYIFTMLILRFLVYKRLFSCFKPKPLYSFPFSPSPSHLFSFEFTDKVPTNLPKKSKDQNKFQPNGPSLYMFNNVIYSHFSIYPHFIFISLRIKTTSPLLHGGGGVNIEGNQRFFAWSELDKSIYQKIFDQLCSSLFDIAHQRYLSFSRCFFFLFFSSKFRIT